MKLAAQICWLSGTKAGFCISVLCISDRNSLAEGRFLQKKPQHLFIQGQTDPIGRCCFQKIHQDNTPLHTTVFPVLVESNSYLWMFGYACISPLD